MPHVLSACYPSNPSVNALLGLGVYNAEVGLGMVDGWLLFNRIAPF